MSDDLEETTDTTSSTTTGQYVSAEKANEIGMTMQSHRGDSADEIDPRRLVRDPTLSELRWYYRETFARQLIDKPIDDAFKNGFEFNGADADEATEFVESVDYESEYAFAQKKARRDGFSIIFIGTKDNTDGVHAPLFETGVVVDEITHLKTFTIDNLATCANAKIQDYIDQSFGLDTDEYTVRNTGIVICTDPTNKEYKEPLGYVLRSKNGEPTFIHRDRVQHFVWNDTVDGDYYGETGLGVRRWQDEITLGKWEGDSELVASYHLLKGLVKGNWAIMQALFRNASKLYAVHLPTSADEEEKQAAERETRNLNSKSSLVFPRGQNGEDDNYTLEDFDSSEVMQPREHYDVIFDQLCATHEMTKSVLFGTQTGVVSGSETDIKNYFNQVEKFRQNRANDDIIDFCNRLKQMYDGRIKRPDMEIEVEWGPLFKVSDTDKFGMFQTMANSLTMMINGYMITPTEARNILSEQWAEWDIDLGQLTEEDRDLLDRINLTQVGAFEGAERAERESGNQTQTKTRGSGMQQGQKTSSLADAEEMQQEIEHLKQEISNLQ